MQSQRVCAPQTRVKMRPFGGDGHGQVDDRTKESARFSRREQFRHLGQVKRIRAGDEHEIIREEVDSNRSPEPRDDQD